MHKLRLISLEMVFKPNPTYDRLNRIWTNSTIFPNPLGYYDVNIYDGLWVLSLSAIKANSTKPLDIMKVLPSVASDYVGATGRCTLNDTGARAGADYDIYAYFEVEGRTRNLLCGSYRWEESRFTWDNGLLG
jgi:ABC-type branched-subunit amino acid transport system substrate-binding protein